ncbi:unnamed protein product [Mytilus coruscus]|uniref:SUEL-type lectin domain-containing protein n=1 Tax=Mytilus coruscus TaxID=42192 RepID=A0A6J8C930_MYTCO|nr:unnamed protein product [Mytilus coruscus]
MNGYISTCMFLLYSIGNKMCVAQDTRNVTFCETEDNLKINCPKNTTIAVQFLTTAQNGETNNDKCLGHFNLLLGDQCSGITNCIVSAMEYFLSSCRMIPKFIKATYTCYCFYWFFPSHFSMYADLSEINCDNHCFFGGILEINNIQVDEGICANCAINEVKTSVSKLCNKKKKCSSPQNDDYCLFHPRYVRIHYSCQEEKNGTSIFPERTTESKTTTEALNWTVSNYSTNCKILIRKNL